MRKLLLLILIPCAGCVLADDKAIKIESTPANATEVARINTGDSDAQKIATFERVVGLLRAQRDLNGQALQDAQAQLQLMQAELAAVRQQLADANAKLAELQKPKDAAKSVEKPSSQTLIKP